MHDASARVLMEVLDGLGTFVFALSGGLLGVRKRFDLFGVLFLSFVVAVVGGMMRDVLIGAVPPAAIASYRYLIIAAAGGLLTFYLYPMVQSRQHDILLFDAVGLALFAVTGTQKAMLYGINPVMAAILGMLSGIGGGMTRDVLAAAAIVSVGHVIGATPIYPMLLGAAACIFLRLMAIYRGWQAPIAHTGTDKGRQ